MWNQLKEMILDHQINFLEIQELQELYSPQRYFQVAKQLSSYALLVLTNKVFFSPVLRLSSTTASTPDLDTRLVTKFLYIGKFYTNGNFWFELVSLLSTDLDPGQGTDRSRRRFSFSNPSCRLQSSRLFFTIQLLLADFNVWTSVPNEDRQA